MRLGLLGPAVLALGLTALPALADWTPPRPINFWIAFGAGGESDAVGRVVAQELAEQTGWDMIVENKPGGGGMAMFTQIAAAPKDGTYIGLGVNMPVLINLAQRPDKVPFKLDSFDYLGTISKAEKAIVARSDAPYDTVTEMLDWAKANGGLVFSASPGPETVVVDVLNAAADGSLRKLAAQSAGDQVAYLMGNQAAVGFGGGAHLPYLESGDLKVIGSINREPLSYAPEAQTLQQAGFDLYIDPYFYIAGPAGLDPEAREALVEAVDATVRSEAVQQAVARILTAEAANLGPEGTATMMAEGLEMTSGLFAQ